MTLSPLPIFARAALSSGLILTSEKNFMKVSLFWPIWSRYCWTVMPCANRSFVTIGSPYGRALPHRGEIDSELRDFFLVGVLHHQHHASLGIYALRRERINALCGISPIVLPDRRPLILYEARPHGLRSGNDLRCVIARELGGPAPEGDPEGYRALGLLQQGVDITLPEHLALEGGVACRESQAVERGHHDGRLPGTVLHAPLAAEFLADDALLAGPDGLITIPVGEGDRYRLAGSCGYEAHREHQERKTPIS